jgi:hypothetical protein
VSVYGVLLDSAAAAGVAALGVLMAAGVVLKAVGFIAGVDPAAGAGPRPLRGVVHAVPLSTVFRGPADPEPGVTSDRPALRVEHLRHDRVGRGARQPWRGPACLVCPWPGTLKAPRRKAPATGP